MTAGIPSYRQLDAITDRVVALCGDIDGARVLDAGCGDGMIGRALLDGLCRDGTLTFLDIEPGPIESLAVAHAGDPRVRTVVGDVQALDGIPDGSVDLVVLRAVLLYVPRKDLALQSALRVLASGGRLVISEPVNRHLYHPAERLWGFDLSGIPEIAAKVQQGFVAANAPRIRAMLDWDDIDLASMVAEAGFQDVRMETVTGIAAGPPVPWLAFIHARWTPWMPSLGQVMADRLTSEETACVERVMRPQLSAGKQRLTLRNTFVTARGP